MLSRWLTSSACECSGPAGRAVGPGGDVGGAEAVAVAVDLPVVRPDEGAVGLRDLPALDDDFAAPHLLVGDRDVEPLSHHRGEAVSIREGARIPGEKGARQRDPELRLGGYAARQAARMAREGKMIVVTTNELSGYRVMRTLGVVRGLSVRSRSIVGNIGASIQILRGGNISLYTKLAEDARNEAYELLVRNAAAQGANAILAMRYDANEMASAVTEVLAYGTAVIVEEDTR